MEPVRSPDVDLNLAMGLSRVSTLMRSLNYPRDLSMTGVSTLATLDRHGPCRLTGLAAYEAVTQPAMTQLVRRLEQAGLVRRDADADDRRVVMVGITAAGREELSRRRAAQAAALAELLAELSAADRAAIAEALPALDRLTNRPRFPPAQETTGSLPVPDESRSDA